MVIECLPWEAFIPRYDRKTTLFYLDPPYWGSERDYGREIFTRDDFTRMAAVLCQLKGSFILSINDVPEIREIFAGFAMDQVELNYTVGQKGAKKVSELIIRGL